MIGEDICDYDRGTGDSITTSTNYLTGKQVIHKKKYNQKLDKDVTLNQKIKTFEKKIIYIEDIDYEP